MSPEITLLCDNTLLHSPYTTLPLCLSGDSNLLAVPCQPVWYSMACHVSPIVTCLTLPSDLKIYLQIAEWEALSRVKEFQASASKWGKGPVQAASWRIGQSPRAPEIFFWEEKKKKNQHANAFNWSEHSGQVGYLIPKFKCVFFTCKCIGICVRVEVYHKGKVRGAKKQWFHFPPRSFRFCPLLQTLIKPHLSRETGAPARESCEVWCESTWNQTVRCKISKSNVFFAYWDTTDTYLTYNWPDTV